MFVSVNVVLNINMFKIVFVLLNVILKTINMSKEMNVYSNVLANMLIQKQEVFVIINVDIILIMILNIVHLNVQKNKNIL